MGCLQKLQPFFPPYEQLQSLNLRNALFRCLDQAKKNGTLGRDTVLRKTMLDECKGERLEEILAVFSNAVLKKVVEEDRSTAHTSLAQQLALENFSYHGERTVLSSLIVAHKASLGKHLRGKEETRAKYHDFSDLLDLNERRIARRHEQLKQAIADNNPRDQISDREVATIQDQVQNNWSGNPEWLESILFGDSRTNGDGLLATRFEKVWKHVEGGSIGDIESKSRVGLLEQLDTRVKNQENRLASWQDFGRTLSKSTTSRLAKKTEGPTKEGSKIDLGFNLHQGLQIGRKPPEDPVQSSSVSLEEYTRLIENMSSELAQVGRPLVQNQQSPLLTKNRISISPTLSIVESPKEDTVTHPDEGWSSESDSEVSPGSTSIITKSTNPTPPSFPRTLRRGRQKLPNRSSTALSQNIERRDESRSISPPPSAVQQREPSPPLPSPPRRRVRTPEPIPSPPLPLVSKDSESDLADAILNSVSAASPSPKKQRHTLSLAERTRLSMSRVSHNQISDLHDDFEIADLPRLTIRSRSSIAPQPTIPEPEPGLHEGLIERTRKSMAGFEAAQKKAQLERRRSVKEEKKKVRQSSYFPKVEEERETPDISAIELMEGDPDYESVFMSRPKIKTSPAVSPRRSFVEDGEY
jgi:hypothetical protein